MTRSKVRLGELGEWGSGGTPLASRRDYYGGDIPWLIIEDLNDGVVNTSSRYITRQGLESSAAKIVPIGTLLIAMYGSIGKLGIAGIPCATNQAIAFCKCDPTKVDTRFLFYALLHARDSLVRAGRGGTQQNLNQEFLRDYEIELPSLAQQQRMAARLDRADRVRRTRHYALQLSDTFLPAVFLELFGDPERNPKGWPHSYLSELCVKFSDGPFGSNLKTSHYTYSGVRVIRLQNIGVGKFLNGNQAFISEEHFQALRRHECRPGDVLIGTLGDPNLRACILPAEIPIALNKADCIQARANSQKANEYYVCWLLNMPSTLHLAPGLAHGETRSRVSMGQLADLVVPVPPAPLQQKFAALVKGHEQLQAVQQEALRQAEHLSQSLLHWTFSSGL